MSWKKHKFKDFLKRSKIPILIEDDKEYGRVTIKIKHNGVSLRDKENGIKIGTKKQFVLKKGQFVLSKIDARYGAFGIAPKEVDNAIITGNFWAYDVDFNIVNIDWFNQFINSQDFYDFCERASSGITHRKYLNEDTFLNSVIYLPEIEEQQIIIDRFKENKAFLIEQSTELTHQLSLVKQLRQAFLREAMQGKLIVNDELLMVNEESGAELLERIKAEKEKLIAEKKIKKQKPLPPISEDEIPFEIPESWVWCRLNDACIKITDGTHHSPVNTHSGEYMYVTAKNIKDNGIDLSNITYVSKSVHDEIYSRCDPEFGDILYIKDGATTGIVTINNLTTPFSLLSSVALLKLNENVFNKFLMYVMRSPVYYDATRNNMYGVALTRVTLTKINNSIIPLPPLSEQNRIVAKLDELMAYCDSLEESIKNSQTQNEMLLAQVLREALEPKEKEVVG